MGFFGLGRSPLKDEDPKKREQAVRDLPVADQGRLLEIALTDDTAAVRTAAAAKVVDTDRIEQLVRHKDANIRAMAQQKMAGIAVDEIKKRPWDRARALLDQVGEQSALVNIALQAGDGQVREAAFAKLMALDEPSDKLLGTVAIQDESGQFGLRALERIGKRQVLKDIAKKAKHDPVRTAAAAKIKDIDSERDRPSPQKQRTQRDARVAELLEEARVLALSTDFTVATERLDAIEQARVETVAAWPDVVDDAANAEAATILQRYRDQLAQRREEAAEAARIAAEHTAARRALLEQWERRLADLDPEVADRPAMAEEFAVAWADVGEYEEDAAAELEARYTDLRRRLLADNVAPEPKATAAAAGPVELDAEATQAVNEILARADELSQSSSWREADQEFKELDKRWRTVAADLTADDERRQRFVSCYTTFKDRRRANREQRVEQREERLTIMRAMVAEAEALAEVEPEDIDVHQQTIKSLQSRWRDIGPVPPEQAKPLRQAFRAACDRAFAPVRDAFEARDWERFAHVPKAEELIEAAKGLAAREVPADDHQALGELATAVKELQANWKKVGQLPRERREELWQEFKQACDVVYERLQPFFQARDQERLDNMARKEALLSELEAQVEQAPVGVIGAEVPVGDDRGRFDKVKAIQEEWKTIGPVPREHDKVIWGRYKGLLDKFYAMRRAQRAERDRERAVNLEQKQAVLAEIEHLADAVEAYKTGTAIGTKSEPEFLADLKELQGRFRAIGHVPRKDLDAVRDRYRTACDRIYGAFEEFFAKQDAARQGNLERKRELLAQLEALFDEEHPEWFRDDVRRIQNEWREVGRVPRDAGDINQRFSELLDRFYDLGRSDRDAAVAGSEDPVVRFGDEVEEHEASAGLSADAPASSAAIADPRSDRGGRREAPPAAVGEDVAEAPVDADAAVVTPEEPAAAVGEEETDSTTTEADDADVAQTEATSAGDASEKATADAASPATVEPPSDARPPPSAGTGESPSSSDPAVDEEAPASAQPQSTADADAPASAQPESAVEEDRRS